MPTPSDSTEPQFWETRYASERTPWDFGGVPQALGAYLKAHPRGGRVLIPGCGSGYEVAAFAHAGYDVTAIDFSPAAVARARERVGKPLSDRILLADFFHHDFHTPFDCVYERTFLCALPPERWPQVAARIAELLRPRGLYYGFFFLGDKHDGPPFGLSPDDADLLFNSRFTLVDDLDVSDSLPLFAGRERWQVRARKF